MTSSLPMRTLPMRTLPMSNAPVTQLNQHVVPRKKQPAIKLTCIALILMGMYITFIYLTIITFGDDRPQPGGFLHAPQRAGSGDGGVEIIVGDRIQSSTIAAAGGKEEVKTSSVSAKAQPQESVKSVHDGKEEELNYVLSGALVAHASRNGTKLTMTHGGVGGGGDGLRDKRSVDDIVASVLSAAQTGDRQYETGGGSSGSDTAGGGRSEDMPVLTAYCEPVNQSLWETKPLPVRDGPATRSSLLSIQYPHVRSCRSLPAQWPINTPPVDLDPFLPWIHDVFPSPDGKHVVFVAQNRRRCFNGQRYVRMNEVLPKGVTPHKGTIHLEYVKNYFMRPQPALFQHVSLKRINDAAAPDQEPRYRLASHEDADLDAMETRFLCRFKLFDPNATPKLTVVGHSLSQFELDYDYHTYRKGYLRTVTEAGYDNHMIWMSQLLFKCPIPEPFQRKVLMGDLVIDDYSTLYVDVAPIRTPPRYTPPREYFPPRYKFSNEIEHLFVPANEWGSNHTLPKFDESGRWENIPVCLPSLMEYGIVPKGSDLTTLALTDKTPRMNRRNRKKVILNRDLFPKVHEVIACTWASTTFKTRSNRAQVGDGKRRLKEWLEFNLLAGFNHIYVYDNSGAFTNEDSLADVIDLFPSDKVTRIDWPCKICSNRDGNEGERSSQYAAESSCRLRFGSHARWLGSFDTDEYLVPMGNFSSMGEVVEEMNRLEVKVAVFKSAPAKPRLDLLEDPSKTQDSDSFSPTVKEDETFLHTYNCNWEAPPRQRTLTHRSKQMYRADYVKLHYVHYATVTIVSQMTEEETKSAGIRWMHRYKERHMHEFDEEREATMLHTKSKVAQNVLRWKIRCKQPTTQEGHCHLGFPFPKGNVSDFLGKTNKDGWVYNCFLNEKIEHYWYPKLVDAIKKRVVHGTLR